MNVNQSYMKLAMEVAETGRGKTSPNPFVGCIIAKDGEIISRGVTQKCGSDHAEIQALKSAGALSKGAEMYVTLEPCCFQGRTPPCTDAIIKAGIKKVIIGIRDPNPRVNGKGIEQLKAAGISVEEGILANEIEVQLEYYLTNIQKQRPFVILKSAMTLDGYTAAQDYDSKWISGEESRRIVHDLRSEVDAIITGVVTVMIDDPMLNNRNIPEAKQPVRVILDRHLRTTADSNIVLTANEQKTIIFCNEYVYKQFSEELIAKGVEVIQTSEENLKLSMILKTLYERGISVVMLESGGTLTSSFEREKLIDKYYIFIAPTLLGNGKKLMYIPEYTKMSKRHPLEFRSVTRSGEDILVIAYPKR